MVGSKIVVSFSYSSACIFIAPISIGAIFKIPISFLEQLDRIIGKFPGGYNRLLGQ
jgi:hypothetical protein